MRVPGLGKKTVEKLIRLRRHGAIAWADLARMHVPMAKLAPFVTLPDHRPHGLEKRDLRQRLTKPRQLALL